MKKYLPLFQIGHSNSRQFCSIFPSTSIRNAFYLSLRSCEINDLQLLGTPVIHDQFAEKYHHTIITNWISQKQKLMEVCDQVANTGTRFQVATAQMMTQIIELDDSHTQVTNRGNRFAFEPIPNSPAITASPYLDFYEQAGIISA